MRLLALILSSVCLFACNSSNKSQSSQEEEHIEVNPVIDSLHTSQNSLDWEGTYKGEVPCKDCDGVELEVIINRDNTFWVKSTAKGKNEVIEDKGEISWESNKSYIQLKGDHVNYHFRLGENKLTFLEPANMPDDAMLTDYVLEKVQPIQNQTIPPTPDPQS